LIFIDPADFTETKQDWRNLLLDLGVSDKRADEMIQERLYQKTVVDSARYGPWSELEVLTALRRSDFTELNSLPLPSVPIVFFVGGKFEVPQERWSKDFNQHKFFLKKTDLNIQHWRRIIDSSAEGSQLIYLPECGHFVHRDNPSAVVEVIRRIVLQ
jgi:pimeloyl-ACP methyl ester carboxylesterase